MVPLLTSHFVFHYYSSCSKFPELFNSFKSLLGFKDPGLPEQLPTASPTPLYPPKERVTEFAAEIGKTCLLILSLSRIERRMSITLFHPKLTFFKLRFDLLTSLSLSLSLSRAHTHTHTPRSIRLQESEASWCQLPSPAQDLRPAQVLRAYPTLQRGLK